MKVWTGVAAAAMAAAIGLAAGAADAQPKGKARKQAPAPAAVTEPAAPPVPSGPPPEPLAAAIPSYAAFQSDISELQNLPVESVADLDRALERAAGQNRQSVMRGWIAYGALTAAQSTEFVQAVRDTAGHYGQARFVRGLMLDPGYAQTLKGGGEAARLALETSRADGERVHAVGARYRQMGYDQPRWSKQKAVQQAARVQRVKNASAAATSRTIPAEFAPRLVAAPATTSPLSNPSAFGGRGFWDTMRITPVTSVAQIAAPTYTIRPNADRVGAVNRMTTLAALYVLGATQDPAAQTERLLNDDVGSKNCFELAQVQFYQCLSAAHFSYENAYCLGEHGLQDMGECIRDAATVDGAMSTPVAGVRR